MMPQGKEAQPNWLEIIPQALESEELRESFLRADSSERAEFLSSLSQRGKELKRLHLRLARTESGKVNQIPTVDWAAFSSRPEKGLVLSFRQGKYLVLSEEGNVPRPAQRL